MDRVWMMFTTVDISNQRVRRAARAGKESLQQQAKEREGKKSLQRQEKEREAKEKAKAKVRATTPRNTETRHVQEMASRTLPTTTHP